MLDNINRYLLTINLTDRIPKVIEEISNIQGEDLQVIKTLEHNLWSAKRLLDLPSSIAYLNAYREIYFHLKTAAAIEADHHLDYTKQLSREKLHEIATKVNEALSQNVIPIGERRINMAHAMELSGMVDTDLFAGIFDDLITQFIVMLWGSIELFINDLARCLLNRLPQLVMVILSHQQLAAHFKGLQFTATSLAAEQNFGARAVGDMLIRERPLLRLDTMTHMLNAFSGDADDIGRTIRSKEINRLFQQRNLVVHRRCIVDNQYISRTGDDRAIGERFRPSVDEVAELFMVVLELVAFSGRLLNQEFTVPGTPNAR